MAPPDEPETRRERAVSELEDLRARVLRLEAENTRLRGELSAADTEIRPAAPAAPRRTPGWIFGAVALGSSLVTSAIFVLASALPSESQTAIDAGDAGDARELDAVVDTSAIFLANDTAGDGGDATADAGDCDEPAWFDDAGIKHYRAGCLTE
jgi:hypothetical protein